MGLRPGLRNSLPERLKLSYAARAESASPAAGSSTVHEREQQDLLDRAFAGVSQEDRSDSSAGVVSEGEAG